MLTTLSLALAIASAALLGGALVPPSSWVSPRPADGLFRSRREGAHTRSRLAPWLHRGLECLGYQIHTLSLGRLGALVESRLRQAGYPGALTAVEVRGALLSAGIAGAWAAWWIASALTEEPSAAVIPMGAAAGPALAVASLTDQARRRARAINNRLPGTLDLVAMSMSAGADFTSAIRNVLDWRRGEDPLAEELDVLHCDISLGLIRKDALMSLKQRVDSPYLADLVTSVLQAEQMGAPLRKTLSIQARSIRTRRIQIAERIAGEMQVKLLAPLIFFMAAVLMIIFGPLFLQFSRGGL